MKKKKILLLIIVVLISVWTIYRSIVPSYSSVLEANWGFELPVKALCKEVYSEDTGPSFHGDGIRYHVFSYRYEDYIDLMFAWSGNLENRTLFYQSYSDAADMWLGELGIPQEQYPDYDACFCWYKNAHDNSEIIVYWNSEINRLYMVENII